MTLEHLKSVLLKAYSAAGDPFGAQVASELLNIEIEGAQACLLVVLDMASHCSRTVTATTPQSVCQSVLHLADWRKSTSYDGEGSAGCLAV